MPIPPYGELALDCFLSWAFSGTYMSIVQGHTGKNCSIEDQVHIHARVHQLATMLHVGGLRSEAFDTVVTLLNENPPVVGCGDRRLKMIQAILKTTIPGDSIRFVVAKDVSKNLGLYQKFVFRALDRDVVIALLADFPDLAFQIVAYGQTQTKDK